MVVALRTMVLVSTNPPLSGVYAVTSQELADLVRNSKGRIISVFFLKRTNNEFRRMRCQFGVKKHLTGGQAAYNFEEKNLICVWDVDKKGYRCIPVERLILVQDRKQYFTIDGLGLPAA